MTTNELADGLAVDAIAPSTPDTPSPEAEVADPFAGIPAPLRAALLRRGFTKLTEVQEAVLRADAATHDLRISSQTGSGKTVAIGMALAERLIAGSGTADLRGPSTLIVTPTRELADQVRGELDWLFADVPGVDALSVTGGTSVGLERGRLARRPRILVATPGRLLDHVRGGGVDLSSVEQLVLDEADQMLDMGFREDLDAILAALTARRRTHMISATFPNAVREFVDRYQEQPCRIEGARPGAINADIEHIACVCSPRDRYGALVNLMLMTEGERTLVFVRTRQDTAGLAEQLGDDGFAAMAISGDMAQPQRTRTLNAFRRGLITTLVATDVAARGIDVPEITQVVHFDPPLDGDIYTHRSGRTGRAGRKGRSVMFVPPAAQRRAERLFRDARVEACWRDLPGPEQVQRLLTEREDARLLALLDDPSPVRSEDLATAARLLEGRDAAAVVASLLTKARNRPICEPREMGAPRAARPASGDRDAPRPQASERGTPYRETAHRDAPHRDAPHRDASRRPARPTRPAQYARFAINWGERDGATPKRLLAHVCRRGGITGDRVGSIDVTAGGSVFEVDLAIAGTFASRTRAPDVREPHLAIHALDLPSRSRA